jgi:hypothetical protein
MMLSLQTPVAATDLARVHQPLTDFVPHDLRLKGRVDISRVMLTDDQIAQFHRDGYLQGIQALSPSQVKTLLEELETVSPPHYQPHTETDLFHEYHANESNDPRNVLMHALGAWRQCPSFHDLVFHPALSVPASQLIGMPVRFFHDQLFCKPAASGGGVAWHQVRLLGREAIVSSG